MSMGSPLPSDPYKALGVSKDADAAAIKSAYRKLVLKCHPDKIADESLKARKAEEFHSIQQAYEILSDDDKRGRYDAQVRLAELRREVMMEGGRSPRADVRTAAFESRTSGMPGATFAARTATRANYEDRRPSYDYFEESSRASSRKYDGYERRPPSRTRGSERDRTRQSERDSEKAMRSDRRRTRERDERRERDDKRTYREDDEYDDRRYDDDRRRRDREEADRVREDTRRRGSLPEGESYNAQMHEARAYMDRAGESRFRSVDDRPDVYRTTSSSGAPRQYYQVRRSSAKPKDRDDDRRDHDDYPRRPPPLQTTNSSPAAIKIPPPPPRSTPQRSHTIQTSDFDHHHSSDYPPPPSIHRSQTTPVRTSPPPPPPAPSQRYKDTQPPTSSKLRRAESAAERHPVDSGYSSNSSPGTPETPYGIPPPASVSQGTKSTSTYYQYPGNGEGVTVRKDSGDAGVVYTGTGRRAVNREPELPRGRDRSSERERDRERDARPPLSRTVPSAASMARGYGRSSSFAYPDERERERERPRMERERFGGSVRVTPSSRGRGSSSPERRVARSPEPRERERGREREWEREERDRDRDRDRDRERERERPKLYGEIDNPAYVSSSSRGSASTQQRPGYGRTNSGIRPEDVTYSRKYGPEDIVYGSGGREGRRTMDGHRPEMRRGATFAY